MVTEKQASSILLPMEHLDIWRNESAKWAGIRIEDASDSTQELNDLSLLLLPQLESLYSFQ